jgi:3-phenylpropionate/cinnamic acid dioxygenase small subunit
MDDYELENRISKFLTFEAELLDTDKFTEWHNLFSDDATYWIPLGDEKDPAHTWMHVYDDALRREERVFHLNEIPFPSQSPPSRTLHFISNLRVEAEGESIYSVRTNQIIAEIRVGDFRQTGLGNLRYLAGEVEHGLKVTDADIRITRKIVRLINRDAITGLINFLM